MIDKSKQRKPSKSHPWVGWKPGFLSEKDKQRNRQPPTARPTDKPKQGA